MCIPHGDRAYRSMSAYHYLSIVLLNFQTSQGHVTNTRLGFDVSLLLIAQG